MVIDLRVSVCISLLITVYTVQHAEAVMCYGCSNIAHAEDCATTVRCGSHQQCYTRRMVGLNLNEYYETGCIAKDTCQKVQFSLFDGLLPLGKKRSVSKRDDQPIVTCFKCCEGELCNQGQCGAPVAQHRRCFKCDDVLSPHDCDGITECDSDQACLVKYFPKPPTFQYRYQLQCQSKVTCQAIMTVGGSNICVKCCDSDYCNAKACDGWKPPNTTTTATTRATQPAVTDKPTTTPVPLPTISFSGSFNVNYSNSVFVMCNTSGPVTSVEWHYHKSAILPEGASVINGNTLKIDSLNETNAGQYTCEANTHTSQSVAKSTHITIIRTKPEVTSLVKIPNQQLSENQGVLLLCMVKGYPHPNVTWEHPHESDQNTVTPGIQYVEENKLIIDKFASMYHTGVWSCVATNSLGNDSKSLNLP